MIPALNSLVVILRNDQGELREGDGFYFAPCTQVGFRSVEKRGHSGQNGVNKGTGNKGTQYSLSCETNSTAGEGLRGWVEGVAQAWLAGIVSCM